ncbi:MAG TPA: hypothetical protein VFH66_03535 [Mycobacteriales bacterium]|nr:hypothetical protein [Mycobacteriales bacterium]
MHPVAALGVVTPEALKFPLDTGIGEGFSAVLDVTFWSAWVKQKMLTFATSGDACPVTTIVGVVPLRESW